jgi:serine protease Do
MNVQFQCPFCGVAMQADARSAESSVECPACGQSFVVEAPAEPVRVKATAVHAPAPPPVRHGHAVPHPRPVAHHKKLPARREEERAKFAIIALLAGAPLLLGGLIWGAVLVQDSRKKAPPPPPDNRLSEIVDNLKKKNEEEKKKEEDERKRTAELTKQFEAGQKRAEQEQTERKKTLLIDSITQEFFKGDRDIATEVAGIILTVNKEVTDLYYDGILGNEPVDPQAEMERRAMEQVIRNPKIVAWAQRNSLDVRRVFGGSAMSGPDGKPVDPDSIQGMLMARKYSGTGTGFWISSDGWILTNAHVAGSASTVDLRDASGAKLAARVVKTDRAKDLALLKVATTRSVWLPIYDKDVPVGTPVFTAGFPQPMIQGLENKVTFGEINSHSGMMDNKDHFQCSVPVQPGNSGGALTARGWAVGVIFSKLAVTIPGQPAPENVSYAIKPSVMRAFIEGVPEAKLLLEPASRPKPDTVERDQAIKRAQDCAVLILVK